MTLTQVQQEGKNVKRIDLYKQKLKAAKAELPMRKRQYNAAARHFRNVVRTIFDLEQKIEHLAKH